MPPKRRQAWNHPGHAHELTFSTCRRQQHFNLPGLSELFLQNLETARRNLDLHIWAYVVMPEHIHILLQPQREDYDISQILKAIKSPFAKTAFELYPELRLGNAVVRPGRATEYRFWQQGGGYDRNVVTFKVAWKSIDYIHWNPVTRGLCDAREDWPYSSYRDYLEQAGIVKVDRCPWWDYQPGRL